MDPAESGTPTVAAHIPTGPGTPLDPFTATTRDQAALEQRVRQFYAQFSSLPAAEQREHLRLRREAHAQYAAGGLLLLPGGFISLDASRPWIVFWIVHSLALLDAPMPAHVRHTLMTPVLVSAFSQCAVRDTASYAVTITDADCCRSLLTRNGRITSLRRPLACCLGFTMFPLRVGR